MKRVLFILSVLLITLPALAQERTMISGKVESGGFGGPVIKFSQVNGDFAVLVGGRGGWIINHAFVIGGGGYGLVNHVASGRPDTLINFGYGGGELEWIIRSNYLLHLTLQTLIGAGGINLNNRMIDHESDHGPSDGVFVAELNANAEFNITTWFRILVGGGYRLVSGVNTAGLKNSDFSSGQGIITLKFGKF